MNPWIKISIALCGATLISRCRDRLRSTTSPTPWRRPHKCGAWMHDDAARAEHRAKRRSSVSARISASTEQKQKLTASRQARRATQAMIGDWKGRHREDTSLAQGAASIASAPEALLNREDQVPFKAKGRSLSAPPRTSTTTSTPDQQQKLRRVLEGLMATGAIVRSGSGRLIPSRLRDGPPGGPSLFLATTARYAMPRVLLIDDDQAAAAAGGLFSALRSRWRVRRLPAQGLHGCAQRTSSRHPRCHDAGDGRFRSLPHDPAGRRYSHHDADARGELPDRASGPYFGDDVT